MKAVAFVPADDVIICWEGVIEPEMLRMKDNLSPAMKDFYNYFQTTYIGKLLENGDRIQPKFTGWNKFRAVQDSLPLTNNCVEAWNGNWNRSQEGTPVLSSVVAGFCREDEIAAGKWRDCLAKPVDPIWAPSNSWRKEEARCKSGLLLRLTSKYKFFDDKRTYLDQVVQLLNL